MNERTLRVLEYQKVAEKLEGYASCSLGKDRAREIRPYTDPKVIKELHTETSEAKSLIDMGKSIPFGGISDIKPALDYAEKGLVLGAQDLLAVANTVAASRKMKKVLSELEGEKFPALRDIGSRLGLFPTVENAIFQAISEAGEVLDNASPVLKLLRNKVKTLNNRIKDLLDKMIKSAEVTKYLQDSIVSLRDGRFVVPVRAEYKSQVPGIVHDQSSSGATVFIEPMGVVEANNDLKQAMIAEENEVERILTELTGRVSGEALMLKATLNCLGQLDFIFARAKMAYDMHATEPELNTQGVVDLKYARHPLLTGNVVPIDPYIGKGFDTLVITGPNTGGKTVTLKTIGLVTLMAQSGLQIPAEAGSIVAIFDKIFADIGDEQSIEQSLSTFSSHLKNIVEILSEVDRKSLVLLDELGAGTDPQEGAAIAMAILSHLHNIGARTAATTHYSELKIFAHTTPGIKNASVEFDVNTLKPTYRLSIGVPGASNAFSIARRLGLPEEILQKATGLLDVKDARVEEMITSLRDEFETAASARRDAEALKNRYLELRDKYESNVDKIKAEKAETLKKVRAQYDDAMRESRRQVEDLISQLKEKDQRADEAAREARKELEKIKSSTLEVLYDDDVIEEVGTEEVDQVISVGDEVEVKGFSTEIFKVLEIKQNNSAIVGLGAMKITVPMASLRKAPKKSTFRESKIEKALKRSKSASIRVEAESAATVPSELDLRGMRVEEALEAVDKFIDNAVLSGLAMGRIIHGKGTGALRQAIKSELVSDRRVKSSRFGNPGEGGDGVTVVKFVE